MEGPGGYQFVGRTPQMGTAGATAPAAPFEQPWLLRFFDQIRFHLISEDERRATSAPTSPRRLPPRIEEGRST
ncbi:MAG: hypothetical protein R3E56_00035 [Burkholderiaceae bacterium]